MRRLPRLDYLITESPPLLLGPTGIALARLKRARWILNVSDLWPDSVATLGVTRSGLVLNAARALERFCYRHAWMVTGQTPGIVRAVIKRAPSTRTRHFSNGVDLALFGESFDDARRSDATCTFVYAGLHGLAQGLDRVVEAAALLDPRDHVRFDFVGDGPTKDALVDQAVRLGVRHMRFFDPVPHDRIPKLLAGADVVIVPLKLPIEGAVPSKLYEAMAAGAAVLLVAEGEPASLLAEAGAGITVQPGDAAEIADAMKRLIADPQARVCMGQRGRTFVQRFDRGRINDELVSVLEAELTA
jgi:glycosyltransferase involved in cell wall biosynthesis